jgi:ATP synthase F1 gamma subunit
MTGRQIRELIEIGNSLKLLAGSYSELASIKLKTIRGRVEHNRQFYGELTQVYALVSKIASSRGIRNTPSQKSTLSLLLTSNYRFYGNINNTLVKYFVVENTKIPGDKLVIGKTGREYLHSIKYFHPFESVIFKNDFPTDAELKSLISKIQSYSQVLIFYPQFQSVLIQKPTVRDITQVQQNSLQMQNNSRIGKVNQIFSQKEFQEQLSFIFEPEVIKMLNFFDRQIKILLLEETLLEAELARTASRLIAMDQAQNNANDFIKDNNKLLAQIKRANHNSQVLETIAGIIELKKAQSI